MVEFDKCLECGEEIICNLYCSDCTNKFMEDKELYNSYLEYCDRILKGDDLDG